MRSFLWRDAARVALGVAAQVQPHAAPVARAVQRHVDPVPRGAPAVIPVAVQVVAHVFPDPGLGERVGRARLRLAEQVVRHVVVVPVHDEAEGEDPAVIAEVAVHVGRALPGDHGLQRRGPQVRHQPLHHREIGDAVQPDAAAAPGLARRPLDAVVVVARLRRRPRIGEPGGLARTAAVDAHQRIAARHPPQRVGRLPVHVRIGLLLEVGRRDPELVLHVGGEARDHREASARPGAEHVRPEARAIAHRDLEVLLDDQVVARLRMAPRRLSHGLPGFSRCGSCSRG